MECTLLGTGGMMPLPERFLTALAVRLNGWIYGFDAGEGTQISWKKARLGLRGLRLIALSHLHADHCLGIPGLLMLKAQIEAPGPVTILGPPGTAAFIQETQRLVGFALNYPVSITEWTEGSPPVAYADEQVQIRWEPLAHTRFCLGYRLEEHERPGKFNPERAVALGIPQGPLWGRLQRGQSIELDSGVQVTPQMVLGAPRPGRHIAFITDTRPTRSIYSLCKDVDVAFIEGMFLPEDAEHAEAKGHMTVKDAARMSRRAGARQAVLIHLSPRYRTEDLPRLEAVAREAFPQATIGRDLQSYPVRYED